MREGGHGAPGAAAKDRAAEAHSTAPASRVGRWSLAALALVASCLAAQPPSVVTSTRTVTCLALGADGTLWAGTTGGILRRDTQGRWRKFTRREGLPSHEVRALLLDGGTPVALLAVGATAYRDGAWQAEARPPKAPLAGLAPQQTAAALWRGAPCVATLTGLRLQEGARWREVALPPSPGTHVSALLARGEALWAALFGDGLWEYDGRAWRRLELGLPDAAREITALAGSRDTLWAGTRHDGIWRHDGGRWAQHLQPDEPPDHNCQAFAVYHGRLYAGTLDEGLAVRSGAGWGSVEGGSLSSDAPRQMVVFRDALYLRHGNSRVDCLSAGRWSRDVCGRLPRKEVVALAADRERLYAGQFGGWSEFDGREWAHHLKLPELQGLMVTTLLPEGDTLWVGTQTRGLAEVSRRTGSVRWHDERAGMPDDWIRCLARAGGRLCAGTFVGGLACLDGARWSAAGGITHGEVTALAPDGAGGLLAGTRTGLWRLPREGPPALLGTPAQPIDPEVQALCLAPAGLWVGTRTGMFWVGGI